MYEPKGAGPVADPDPLTPGRVIAWLKDRSAVEHVVQASLGGPPSERDATLARMADVLQATAQGLGPGAAAVWAGVPEFVLQGWIDKDPAFAAALGAAAALAGAHGLRQGGKATPAMVRVLLVAMSNGATKLEAVKLSGFQVNRLRALVKASSTLKALLETARRVRPLPAREAGVRGPGQPRRPGRKPPEPWGFRLVQRPARDDPRDGGESASTIA
ncbi:MULTISPECIES: hypothetical protein [unclassified Streptomyces]|uniref:hypothetical protein n=1 Tax=unclassified Streptomyces TaxID=2593676 RepID=UPI0033AF1DAC